MRISDWSSDVCSSDLANRITLLRDADGDGKAEVKSAYITGLNSPYGMALVGDTLYVANTDALLAFPYVEGATSMAGKAKKIADQIGRASCRERVCQYV